MAIGAKHSIIAIDGPGGSGKSSAARLLADRLEFVVVDTGALYRTVGYAALRDGIPLDRPDAIGAWVGGLTISATLGPRGLSIRLAGEEITSRLRSPRVSRAASVVAAISAVRKALLDLQRQLGESGDVVMEGRDVGTVIFPNCPIKFFLDARPEIRAARRQKELAASGADDSFDQTRRELAERDGRDTGRAEAPLKPAPDAVRIDSSELTLDAVVDRMFSVVRERLNRR